MFNRMTIIAHNAKAAYKTARGNRAAWLRFILKTDDKAEAWLAFNKLRQDGYF